MPGTEIWGRRLLTAQAAGLLCLARLLIGLVPFRLWKTNLGYSHGVAGQADAERARSVARQVERAVMRLPFSMKCLPQAMALSWLLRRNGVGHRVVIAVRPPALRQAGEALHAWVEAGGEIVLGDLPGPWHELYRVPDF